MIATLLLVLLFVVMAAYYSGVETGAYCMNKIRLRFLAEKKSRSAQILQGLMQDMPGFICTTLVGHNVAVYLATALLISAYDRHGLHAAELLSTISLAPVLLILAEVMPKNIFQMRADNLMYFLGPSIAFSKRLFWPAVWMLKRISGLVAARAQDRETGALLTTRRLWYFIDQGTHEGILTPYQNLMAKNVTRIGQTALQKAMIPLDKAVLVSKSVPAQEYRQLIAEKRFSRMPVYEGSWERVVGILNCFDFFCDGEGKMPAEMMRPAIRLPQTMAIDDALHVLQHARSPMGVVVNDRDSAVGIVTIKDLVEEIVGELEVW